jgi:hypothetical protein
VLILLLQVFITQKNSQVMNDSSVIITNVSHNRHVAITVFLKKCQNTLVFLASHSACVLSIIYYTHITSFKYAYLMAL